MINSGNSNHRQKRFQSADKVIKIGFWLNAILMVMKLAAGYFGKSEAVFADGIESGCDFIALLASFIALRIGRQPLDRIHPYGHGRAESIAAIFVSLVIFLTGAGILARSVHTIVTSTSQSPSIIALVAALVTIAVKEWLYRFTGDVGKRLESPAVMAVAKDHRKDAVSSVATLVGVSGAYLGFSIMDPLAAGVTALFIFHIAIGMFRSSAHELMDAMPSRQLVTAIAKLAGEVRGVDHVHQIKARRSGQYVIVDLKLEMDPEMTVKISHEIATEVKKRIFHNFPSVGDVMIHINPRDEKHRDLTRL